MSFEEKVEPVMQPTPTPASPETSSTAQASSEPTPAREEPELAASQAAAEIEEKSPGESKPSDFERDIEQAAPVLHPEARPHAFVIMPFGKKKGADGSLYDFNAVYSLLIKPALEMAGFEAFRADEETSSGDILTDMFQELLLADLCIADMSIDNANVFYELGIRHAFRKRGIVHIQAGRAYMPFDVFNVRTIPYHITPEGVPDPEFLEKDKAAISRVTRDTWASDIDAVHSPIFNLLDGLVEPDRKTLETPLATGFWREYNEWKDRVTVAERQKRIGDILLLTEEIQNPLIKEDAIGEAGLALKNMGYHDLALAQYRSGLEVNVRNLTFRREEAFNLNRLGKADEAVVKIEKLLADTPTDTETVAYLGRIYKEMWLGSWKDVQEAEPRRRAAFESYHWLLKSFQTYLRGYRLSLNEFYPGINAYTLGSILVQLANEFEDKTQPDPEIQGVRALLPALQGSLRFALETRAGEESVDYWALVSLGELLVLTADIPPQVSRSYRKALTASQRNQFYLKSSLGQLEILRSLNMRPEFVEAGIDVLEDELRRIRREVTLEEIKPAKGKVRSLAIPNSPKVTGMVFLFTGYMVSNPRKKGDEFPPEKEGEIRAAIQAMLDKYDAGPDDLAVTTGMDAGSEILFVESCVERHVPVQAYFPLSEAPYVREFVIPGGEEWVERFYRMRNHPLVEEFYQSDCVGLPRQSDNVHERNNRWALYSALVRGIDKVRLVAFWDGKGEVSIDLDARLVKHMVELMRHMGGMVEQIHPAKLARLITSSGSSDSQPLPIEPVKAEMSTNGKSRKKRAVRRTG
jgi:tetratricopeptide (TPR) repeat protein